MQTKKEKNNNKKIMASLVVDNNREDPSKFYTKYLWKQISRNDYSHESGRILRTIYCQFGKWCVDKHYMIGDNYDTKLFWLKTIVSYLCHEDPCVKVLRGHTSSVQSLVKLNETTIVSGGQDNTLRVWDLTKKFAPKDIPVIIRGSWLVA